MREEKNRIDERHRKELLGFLLVKTAAVRQHGNSIYFFCKAAFFIF